jgi:hypothetical protein
MKHHRRRRNHLILSLLATALLLMPGAPVFGGAADITGPDFKTLSFQNGAGGYSGAVDARIAMQSPDAAPDAKAAILWVSRTFDPDTGKLKNAGSALLRFDGLFGTVPGQIPPGSPVTRAILRLRTASSDHAGSANRLYLNRMLLPWDKSAAWSSPAWNGDGIQPDDREARAEPDTLGTLNNKGTFYDLDVTDSLRAWAAGEPNHGWLLHHVSAASTNALGLVSSLAQGSALKSRPRLTVTFDAAPANRAPEADRLSASRAAPDAATLSLRATDPDASPLSVTFLARRQPAAAPDFQIILLPDTQCYTRGRNGGTPEMFIAQTAWIVRNAAARNIAAVLHLGDITDRGDMHKYEWDNAAKAMYLLEDPAATGRRPDGIPYCLAVGNHDQRRSKTDWDGPAAFYNQYFGVAHFSSKSYYGGHFGNDNNNYYILFESGSEKFIAISLEYKAPRSRPDVLAWARDVLRRHSGRRAILITHGALTRGTQPPFHADGGAAYKALRDCKNLMLIIGGHISGEGRRTDTHNGATVHSILMDFQGDRDGGSGQLGILTLSPRSNKIHAAIHSPHTGRWRTDLDATYSFDYDFGAKIEPFAKVAAIETTSGGTAGCRLENMDATATYEWCAEISDRGKTTRTPARAIPPAPAQN